MGIEHRGFAGMSKTTQREIASKGGVRAHQKGTAHKWTPEEARAAGIKARTAAQRRQLDHAREVTLLARRGAAVTWALIEPGS